MAVGSQPPILTDADWHELVEHGTIERNDLTVLAGVLVVAFRQ